MKDINDLKDFEKSKMLFAMIGKEDKKILISLIYKYKDKLGIDSEYIKKLSKVRGMNLSNVLKSIIENMLKSEFPIEDVSKAIENMDKLLSSDDKQNIKKLSFIPDFVKEGLHE